MAKAKVTETTAPTLEAKVAELETKNAEQAATIKQLFEANQTLEEALAEQHKQLNEVAEKSATSTAAVSVEVAGKQYEIVVKKFNFKGAIVTAEELSENGELAAELVEIGAAVLKEIV